MVNSWQNFTPWAFGKHFICAPKAKNLSIKGKKILITGGNGGIGKQTVLNCAKHGAAKVVICARNVKTGETAVEEMKAINPEGDYRFQKLDLGDQEQVKKVAEELSAECDFDTIILNAGVLMKTLKRTKDGHEMMFGINHLGHYSLLLTYFNCKESKDQLPARVVTLGSIGHVCKDFPWQKDLGMRFDDINYEREDEFNYAWAYGQSKLGPMLFAKSLAEKFPNMLVNTLHPGWVRSELFSRDMGAQAAIFNKFLRSTENGCQTILHLAFSDSVKESGKYWENCVIAENNLTKFGNDKEQRDRLWEMTENLTGVKLDSKFTQ